MKDATEFEGMVMKVSKRERKMRQLLELQNDGVGGDDHNIFSFNGLLSTTMRNINKQSDSNSNLLCSLYLMFQYSWLFRFTYNKIFIIKYSLFLSTISLLLYFSFALQPLLPQSFVEHLMFLLFTSVHNIVFASPQLNTVELFLQS